MSEQTYKLYAVKLSAINHEQLKDFERSLIPFGRSYALIFTDKSLKKPFVEIPPETELTEQERKFVVGCKLQVNAKAMREHEAEISDGLNSLMDELEKALAEEQKKIGEKK